MICNYLLRKYLLGGGELLFTTLSTLTAVGLAGYSYLKLNGSGTSDADKIQKIFANAGWQGKGGETR